MVMASIYGVIKEATKENENLEKCLAKVFINGAMADNMKASLKMI